VSADPGHAGPGPGRVQAAVPCRFRSAVTFRVQAA